MLYYPQTVAVGKGFWKCNVSTLSDGCFQQDFQKVLCWLADVMQQTKELIIRHSHTCRLFRRDFLLYK